ncbi:erlin-2-B [Heracleum sosnowskyi]|uniref:Erlin-2-B n=1 Tax=Heracleum sosnowskyi TaxID=360622 RepID=A0AAD8H544_9APIA|nr:erlin-2-B [Heracleum sosnowskyi]
MEASTFFGLASNKFLYLVHLRTCSISIVHQVPEGHLGAYWRGGALLKTLTDPGFHLKLPLITEFQPIQVTLQTDQARNIPCGTKGGVMISFEKIEVVNHLYKDFVLKHCKAMQVYVDVFDQIEEVLKEALQADCRHYAPGIEILSVHVTKPVIPNIIRRSFELMEERIKDTMFKDDFLFVGREQLISFTAKPCALGDYHKFWDGEMEDLGSFYQMEQKLAEQNSIREQEDIRNAIYLCKEKSIANADFFRMISEAEANKRKLTPQFLELKFIEAIANNSKYYLATRYLA